MSDQLVQICYSATLTTTMGHQSSNQKRFVRVKVPLWLSQQSLISPSDNPTIGHWHITVAVERHAPVEHS